MRIRWRKTTRQRARISAEAEKAIKPVDCFLGIDDNVMGH